MGLARLYRGHHLFFLNDPRDVWGRLHQLQRV
jgi:hypothetical protein